MNVRTVLSSSAAALAAWFGLSACLPPAAGPEHPDRAVIGISVENQWESFNSIASPPMWVHLVRWSGEGDVTAQSEVVTTNFKRGNRFYLLNAKPGRYAVIATTDLLARHALPKGGTAELTADGQLLPPRDGLGPTRGFAVPVAMRRGGSSIAQAGRQESPGKPDRIIETTYLNEEMIGRTVVEVSAGQLTFLGHVQMRRAKGISKGDRAVKHFRPLKNPQLLDHLGQLVFPDVVGESLGMEMTVARDKNAKVTFLQAARSDLEGSGWQEAVTRAMAAVASRPPMRNAEGIARASFSEPAATP